MARIDYLQIEKDIKALLGVDPELKDATIEVEESANLNPDKCPWVGIYLSEWETPADEEQIGGATPFITYLTFEIWCYEFSLTNEDAIRLRNTLLYNVKEVLKANRKPNSSVLVSRFGGGEFDNPKAQSDGFFHGGSIRLICEVRE